jgi:hypothetical protein
MKINKVSDEKVAPTWAFGSKSLDNYEKTEAISKKDIERLNIADPKKITESVLSKECDAIEKCATTGKTYHYNSTWEAKDVNHLKEFASVCGLDANKVKGVDPKAILKEIGEIEQQASTSYMIKTASKVEKLVLQDPFHLDERANTSHMDYENWQKTAKQGNLSEAPSIDLGAIKAIRGGENYFSNPESKNAINQNSITNPNAIKEFIESEKVDNGMRLKQEKLARDLAKKENTKEWENSIIEAMPKNDIVPKGNVFPTETMNAQSGLNSPSSKMGVYSDFKIEDVPTLTEGEKIKLSQDEHKKSIQRPIKEKEEFHTSSSSVNKVSDTFADELKKYLK